MLGKTDDSAGATAPAAAPARRGATELLYDSEASLRLIDAALDDINVAAASEARAPEPGRQSLQLGPAPAEGGDLSPALRAYWEVQDLLDSVQQGRSRVGRSLAEPSLIGAPYDDQGTATRDVDDGLYRALLLVDRMDPAEGVAETDRAALCAQLRSEILNVMSHLRHGGELMRHLEATGALLYNVETRLTQLSAALDPGEPAWMEPD